MSSGRRGSIRSNVVMRVALPRSTRPAWPCRHRSPRACGERSVMSGFGRSDRDAEGPRNLGQRQPEVVVQDDDGALFGMQARERQVKQFSVCDERCYVGYRRSVDRQKLDFDRSSPPTSQDVDAGADDETSEPALEAIRIAERRQVPPGSDETLLDRVSRELVVPENQSAAASSRATNARASTAKASRSPRCARSTSSRWSTFTLRREGAASVSRSQCMSPWITTKVPDRGWRRVSGSGPPARTAPSRRSGTRGSTPR